ncbi:MAG: hypothetical protein IPP51_14635 [Bacteroidetes bacterium]|nr:hypothetical protein [Bacteroidota bacterium]
MQERSNISNHLSSEDIIRYQSQLMNSAEMHRVEKHLLECSLCDEAMHGISKMDDSMHLYKLMHDLKQRGRKKYKPAKKIFALVDINTLLILFFILGILIFIGWYFIVHPAK